MEKPKKVKVCCPECSKYFMATPKSDGSLTGQCPNCKVVFFTKGRCGKEKLIKLKYLN